MSALHNGGEALIGLGDLQAARVRFLRCLDAARAKGLDRTPAALWGLAEVDFQAGRLGDARAAFEEAAELARETGERQILVPALTRLATIMATAPRGDADLKDAQDLAEEAVGAAPDETRSEALTALGWVLLARGDLAGAAGVAEEAADVARAVQNRRSLGPVLELAAEAATDPRESGALLLEALAVYQRSGAALAADRAQLALARLPGQVGPRVRRPGRPRAGCAGSGSSTGRSTRRRPPTPVPSRSGSSVASRSTATAYRSPGRRGARGRRAPCSSCSSRARGARSAARRSARSSGPTTTRPRPATGCRCCSRRCAEPSTPTNGTRPSTSWPPTPRASGWSWERRRWT
ncbi:MAG: hypothetical protein U0R78_12855 [Nocardioidaceae bacterium]